MTGEQPFDVVREYPGFQLRWYPEHVGAETRFKGSFEGVGNKAFMRVVGYIGGRNRTAEKVAMTAPVVQQATEEDGRYVVSFVMRAGFEEKTAPDPTDESVRLRTVPAQTAAALRFPGRRHRGRYDAQARELLRAVEAAGLQVDGPLRFAQFDPPWTPGFLRRNEVVVPVRPPAA